MAGFKLECKFSESNPNRHNHGDHKFTITGTHLSGLIQGKGDYIVKSCDKLTISVTRDGRPARIRINIQEITDLAGQPITPLVEKYVNTRRKLNAGRRATIATKTANGECLSVGSCSFVPRTNTQSPIRSRISPST